MTFGKPIKPTDDDLRMLNKQSDKFSSRGRLLKMWTQLWQASKEEDNSEKPNRVESYSGCRAGARRAKLKPPSVRENACFVTSQVTAIHG